MVNHLYRTRTYLVGHMQNVSAEEGCSWRDKITPSLEEMGIIVYNPYHKPFIKDVQEGPVALKRNLIDRENGNFDALCANMKEIRAYDLNLVDRSDFIVAHIDPYLASWGSAEELFTANRMKKPIFLSVKGGRKLCPLWIFGVIPAKYIYDSPEDIVVTLRAIDDGSKETDSDRWRLLRKDLR